jgi:probable F420-dependent oxidoreductase
MGAPTLGILHDLRQPLPHTKTYSAYYAECLEEIAEADRLGFRAVWMSEHHLTPDGLMPSPLVAAAAIAARTDRIMIGTSILVLPLHHPLRIAEDAAVVDLMSGGRLLLGVGQGYAKREFDAMGVDLRTRSTRLEEGISVLRQALTTGRVDFHGRHWSFDDLPVTPSPLRPVPIYLGGTTEPALRRAARIGDAVIVYCATPDDLRGRRALLDTALATRSDENTSASVPLICTGILHVADDPEQAWAEAESGIAYLEGQIAAYSTSNGVPASTGARLAREQYLVGTPDEVANRLIQLHQDLRFSHFAYWARLPGLSHTRTMETLHMVATRVAPAPSRTTLGQQPTV